jgi:endonuclease G
VPDDYKCTGYDRGHMTPVGDFATHPEENDTFTMANMVPQWPNLNEGLWARLERRLQDVAMAQGTLYVVTGPGFGPNPSQLNGRVAVPVMTWKAVYNPAKTGAAVYVGENQNVATYRVISVAELITLTGIDPFPSVSATVKATASALPVVETKYIRKSPTKLPVSCAVH